MVYIPWPARTLKKVGLACKTRFSWFPIPITGFLAENPVFLKIGWYWCMRLSAAGPLRVQKEITDHEDFRDPNHKIDSRVEYSRFRSAPWLATFNPNSKDFLARPHCPTVWGGHFQSPLAGLPSQQLPCSCTSCCWVETIFFQPFGVKKACERQYEFQLSS